MAIDTSLFINIISQFKTKGIKDAQKGFSTLDRRTAALNKSLGILARRVAVFETLRRSFNAFVEDDAAARRLNTTLNNLGLSFSALGAEDYIAKLERTTGVLDDQLRPAFETLSRVTGNFEQTQNILTTALDVAAGTGLDVVTVSKALSRAYAGNTTSLARLNTGLTKAELATGDFALVQEKLNSLFAGQTADQLDTYNGKVKLLKVGFENAKEELGKGLIKGLEALGSGDIQNTINFLVKSAELIGKAFAFAGKNLAFIKDIFTKDDFFSAESQLELFEKYRKADDPAKIRASARERSKALQAEKRAEERLARLRAQEAAKEKARLAAQKKAEQDKLKLQTAGQLFDDERISIAAALQNESLDRNEILRLELKKALINENADRAEKLAGQLRDSQRELASLQAFKLANPFQEWEDSLNRVRAGVASLGVPVAPVSPQGTITGQVPQVPSIVPPGQSGYIPPSISQEDLFDAFGRGSGVMAPTININVSGTGGLDAETKQAVVDAVVEASSNGISTGWYRTTNRVAI